MKLFLIPATYICLIFLTKIHTLLTQKLNENVEKCPLMMLRKIKKKILNLLYLDLHQKLTGYILGQDESC